MSKSIIFDDVHQQKIKEYKSKMERLSQFLKSKYDDNKINYIVVDGSDYDGLQSYLEFVDIFPNSVLLGFYDRTSNGISIKFVQENYQEIIKNNDVICLDCELEGMINITNHFSFIKSHPLSLNFIPNKFELKNPLSTYAIICSMVNRPVDTNTFFYADGGYYVSNNYKENILRWSNEFKTIQDGVLELKHLTSLPQIRGFEYMHRELINNGYDLNYFKNNLTRSLISFDFIEELKKHDLHINIDQKPYEVKKIIPTYKVYFPNTKEEVEHKLSLPNNIIQCNQITSKIWVGVESKELKELLQLRQKNKKFVLKNR